MLLSCFSLDLNNLNSVVMFLVKGFMTHCLLATASLVKIVDLCISGIQYGFGGTFVCFLEKTLKNVV